MILRPRRPSRNWQLINHNHPTSVGPDRVEVVFFGFADPEPAPPAGCEDGVQARSDRLYRDATTLRFG
jgi:hypothetical protein